MTKEERFEKFMPKYLKQDIEEYMKYKDDPKCTVKDCLLDEIYGSINSAYWDGEISEEQAEYLRKKYYIDHGEVKKDGTN